MESEEEYRARICEAMEGTSKRYKELFIKALKREVDFPPRLYEYVTAKLDGYSPLAARHMGLISEQETLRIAMLGIAINRLWKRIRQAHTTGEVIRITDADFPPDI